ncbi:MAG: hypothetical protein M1819_004677 [Sarea resinae]|nr:MAG: hypothetical protein M1819_004677 [Sarea resinae]
MSRSTNSNDGRYSREQLLEIFRNQREAGDLKKDVSSLYVGDWEPRLGNPASSTPWNRRDDHNKDAPSGPDICWDHDGTVQPVGLHEMSEEERDVCILMKAWSPCQLANTSPQIFSTSVNSPIKPPQSASKEAATSNGVVGRKTSLSQGQNNSNATGVASPTSARAPNRRRETGDSAPFSNQSPSGNGRFFRDEPHTATPPPSLLRRRTDYKEGITHDGADDKDKEVANRDSSVDTSSPFGSLKRSVTGPFSAGLTGPSSPWASTPQSAGASPMGAFGSFAIGDPSRQPTTPGDKKSGFGSLRGESRFKGLMSKDSSEDIGSRMKEKTSMNSLERLKDTETRRWEEVRSARPLSSDTDPFGTDEGPVDTATIGSLHDGSPPNRQRPIGRPIPGQQPLMEEGIPGFHDLMQQDRRDRLQQMSLGQQQSISGLEPMSPTDTNPYQSPEVEKADTDDIDTDGSDIQASHLPGLTGISGDQGIGSFGIQQPTGAHAGYEGAASDRSQTSSAGPGRGMLSLGGLAGLGGLGGATGWPAGPGSVGTPNRERSGFQGTFGDSIFGPMGDLQSPSLAGLGGSGIFGNGNPSNISGSGTIGRGSKMGSLFPAAMQEQMRGVEQSRQEEGSDRQIGGAFASGTPGLGGLAREADSPMRAGRGMFDDLFGPLDRSRVRGTDASTPIEAPSSAFGQSQANASFQMPMPTTSNAPGLTQQFPQQQRNPSQPSAGKTPSSGTPSNQPPTTQQRTMVMPDRMRWIYRDPQGITQGPWSGLEMHDWYKAGFFSPELLVKKFEEPDYEPLAQLIRRIGNSREPFLVPQIGIPHGPPAPSSQWSGPGGAPAPGTAPVQAGAAQPPFANSFPSFGTTLTAEQQNALERRKQEEQYLMARQKEHLAQQQVMMKQMQQMGPQHAMHPQQLHHHSSAHSLQSQPSFGSITSPNGYQPSPTQGPIQGVPGFFDSAMRQGPGAAVGPGADPFSGVRDEDMPALLERLNMGGRTIQPPFGTTPNATASQQQQQQQENNTQSQQIAAMLGDRARLQREQQQHDAMQQAMPDDGRILNDRLQQFQELRGQREEDRIAGPPEGVIGKPVDQLGMNLDFQASQAQYNTGLQSQDRNINAQSQIEAAERSAKNDPEHLSLTEQVQKAAASQPQSPWAKTEPGMPQPFPPPQSSSPLPAPAAQRNRQNVAEALTAESRSRSQTPSVDTPSASIAPWAKESSEAPKGPSLKEIQEAEARKAAEKEEIAAAARRALLEQERLSQPAPPTPGLPSTSTWGSGTSPATPSSVWAKPVTGKVPTGPSATATKKTLQQIQKEEEARKMKAAAAAAVANASASNAATTSAVQASVSAGKRYADLASKVATPPTQAAGSGAWTTVGASGKVKTPLGSAPAAPASTLRSVASGKLSTVTPATPKSRPTVMPSKPVGSSQPNANEEFTKWAKNELARGLHSNINVDDFVQQLLSFPAEAEIISECVHANSSTMVGHRFAEEFLRRRKLAERGIIEPASGHSKSFSPVGNAENKGSGGWNEVAKKGSVNGAKDEGNSAFKVVAPKKKGKR